MNFQNLNVLITGASSGIGAEFAEQFHAQGARLILVARRRDRLQDQVIRFNQLRPNSAQALVADLSVDQANAGQSQEGITLGLFGVIDFIHKNQIDILVNNAGRGSFGYFEKLPLESELQLVQLNVLATLRLAHAVIPQMKQRRSGAIICLSSIAGSQALPYMATYSATKAFNLIHTLSLRYELRPFCVRVLTVCPGPVATEFGGVARVPGKMTNLPRNGAHSVVTQSIDALKQNAAIVTPCLGPKCIVLASKFLPRALTTWVTERILKSTLDAVEHPETK